MYVFISIYHFKWVTFITVDRLKKKLNMLNISTLYSKTAALEYVNNPRPSSQLEFGMLN